MRRLIVLALPALLTACQGHDRYGDAKALIAVQCVACHQVPGVRGAQGWVGPSLAGIGRQQVIAGKFANSPDTMVRWLMHPQAMVPGNAMPEMGLSENQARSIANYLYTLDNR